MRCDANSKLPKRIPHSKHWFRPCEERPDAPSYPVFIPPGPPVSAIYGLLHLDGRPIARDAITAMSAALAHRGQDDCGVWIGDTAALGHRMLYTTPESLAEIQPVVRPREAQVLVSDAPWAWLFARDFFAPVAGNLQDFPLWPDQNPRFYWSHLS